MSSNQTKYILLVGPPNAGKTTLFNLLTGSRHKTMNYPGSTVEFNQGSFLGNASIKLIDIPGISSLVSKSEDEAIALKAIGSLDALIPNASPDLIISVVDSTQRSRHLSLTKQIMDLGVPMVVVLSMSDLALKIGKVMDTEKMSKRLGCPVVSVDGRHGDNLTWLKLHCFDQLKLSEKAASAVKLPTDYSESTFMDLYDWADELIKETQLKVSTVKAEFNLDKIFLHAFWGPVLFLGIMGSFFYSIFSLASPLMDWVDTGLVMLSNMINTQFPETIIRTFITDGVITGFSAILVFVPQISILFLGIGILESTGYLARGAVLVDRPLSKVGLNGRSFMPLLSGCACAIPAMMATRTIPGHKQRMLCLFVIPLMQCSARLPVYGLLLSLLFPGNAVKSGIALTFIYLLSVGVSSVVSAIAAKWMGVTQNSSFFQIELPQWRFPIWRNVLFSVYHQSKSFVVNAGPIIFIIALVLWVISVFPSEGNSIAMMLGRLIEPIFLPMGLDWRVGVAIILSFAAREVFVSALAVLFVIDSSAKGLLSILEQASFQGTSIPIFTTASMIGLILFFMIALQCGTTVAIARKEMGSWKLPLIQLFTYILGAYVLSVCVVQVLRLLGIQ
ncbi:ferrous iron transporter B [Candidatus Marinamargulisbacteria bacterium SCGC AG-439-L15]|nr:ferrous iron transporter B [Candidatus Marinamargulisbacteria bacterium SCGC AG-439-L15]